MNTDNSTAPLAAAVYGPNTTDRAALLKFVEKLKTKNVRIGGLLQEALFDSDGGISGLNAVDVSTNQRIPITQVMDNDDDCAFDVPALADTSGVIRKAIEDRPELMVVEKFGELEQKGEGLIDEIFETIVEGIPLIISVPEAALPLWQERSGEMGSVISFAEDAFEEWWQRVR